MQYFFHARPIYSLQNSLQKHSHKFSSLETVFYFKLRYLGGHVSFFSLSDIPFILYACFAIQDKLFFLIFLFNSLMKGFIKSLLFCIEIWASVK